MDPVRQATAVTWIDLGTTDIDRSREFYQGLFGWTFSELRTDEGSYFTALIGDEPVCGLMGQSANEPNDMPSVWTVFFSTADIDDDVRRVEEAGGSVVRKPFEIPGGDRIAVVADAAGAVFAIATFSAVGGGRLLRDQPGSVCWVDCQTRDVEASVAFYERLFGWTSNRNGDYYLLERSGIPVAGLMEVPDGVPDEVPSYWFVYWQVDDLAGTTGRAIDAGGTVLVPTMEIGDRSFTVIEDPTGAVFALMDGTTSAVTPEIDARQRQITSITSKFVVSVEPETTLRSVVEHFVEDGIGFVVVTDAGSVAGVVSEHDVLRAIHDGADIDEVWVADVMSTDLVTARPEESIGDAARRMVENRVRHLLVFGDEGGVVSIRDVLEAITP